MEPKAQKKAEIFVFIILVGVLCSVFSALRTPLVRAQESLSLSLTPPLYQVVFTPGQEWATTLKIINSNAYDLKVYATVADFKSEGEAGQAQFIPIASGSDDADSLGRWITITRDVIVIPPNRSSNVAFTVRVPENASPGGHYAAILVGTQPALDSEQSGAQVSVSSMVTSLIFARVEGDVIESGDIREFSSSKTIYQTPSAEFNLKFENTGNVHVTPQGDISIYDMWGRKRGSIPVNHRAGFGSVLPESTRKFTFKWDGGDSLLDMGRYEAVATITFGSEARQNISRTLYFWVVPFKVLGIALGGLILLVLFIIWIVRLYIKRALKRLTPIVHEENIPVSAPQSQQPTSHQPMPHSDVMDLRNKFDGSSDKEPNKKL